MSETVDLKARLQEATLPYDPTEGWTPPETEENPDEFHPPETGEQETETEGTHTGPGPVTDEGPEPEEDEFDMEPEDLAALLIGGTNFLQTRFFRKQVQARYKARMSREELKRLDELARREQQDGKNPTTYDDRDLELISKLREFEEQLQSVPFTDEEQEMIRGPLVKVIGKYNVRLTPEWALVFAVGQVMLPRVMLLWAR